MKGTMLFFWKADLYFQTCMLIMECNQGRGFQTVALTRLLPTSVYMMSLDKSSRHMSRSSLT